ncbi:MAG: 16S rRNA (cytidine(1402)-2'-O)-methyltransferase [Christensenellales bacterium]|jgi:16S rRNA (cytidine1402-2'-O)-methyltransferase
MSGTLYIVGTPIGNLEDITLRAARILAEVDIVAAEDTRRTLQLLNHLGCPKRLISYREHNRKQALPGLLALLREGKNIALCTDAGMPCISDPGWELVDACRNAGIPVAPVPGPTAVATAAAASGMDSRRFYFEGFLPRQGKERKRRVARIAGLADMVLLYEAPHRLAKTLADLAEAMPERPACLCKDLTKKFEAFFRDSLSALAEVWGDGREVLGEYVLVLGPWQPEAAAAPSPEERLEALRAAGYDKKTAVATLAAEGFSKKDAYKLAETLWRQED